MQFAVDALEVEHIIVCGHYNCGGIKAALLDQELGLIENWLRHIQDVRNKFMDQLNEINDVEAKINRLCELNVIEQVVNVCRTTIVRDAWRRGQKIAVHGWVYGLDDGLLRDTGMCVTAEDEVKSAYLDTIKSSAAGIA
jgi:carbonic anhydrase